MIAVSHHGSRMTTELSHEKEREQPTAFYWHATLMRKKIWQRKERKEHSKKD